MCLDEMSVYFIESLLLALSDCVKLNHRPASFAELNLVLIQQWVRFVCEQTHDLQQRFSSVHVKYVHRDCCHAF